MIIVKWSNKGGPLLWQNWCIYKKRKRHKSSLSVLHVRTEQEGGHLQTRKRVLTRNWICWLLALRLPSLQNCEKEMSVVSASLSWYFVLAAWADQDNGLVIAMCFQLPEISAKTGSLLKDMKTESWPRACSFMPQTCSHDGGFDIAYSNKHQIKKNKIHHSKKIGL